MKPNYTQTTALSVEIAAERFAALGSPHRLQVLRALVRAGDAGLAIGELGKRVGITGSTLTHHMKILVSAGLASQHKQGRSVICAAVDFDQIAVLSQYLLAKCCADCSVESAADTYE